MKQLFFSLFAIGLAACAAIAATSLFLSAPMRIGPTAENSTPPGQTEPQLAIDTKDSKPATTPAGTPPTPSPNPDGKAPTSAPGGATPPAGDAADTDEGPDKDPYEGIAPEELPPDLQYNADSSVSFPTNI